LLVSEAIAPKPQFKWVLLAAAILAALFTHLLAGSFRAAGLVVIGGLLGFALYHASFGFTGAYRRAILDRDYGGVLPQLIMLAVATVLFAPALADGMLFGNRVGGAVAPVSIAMASGAFIFGIGMQLGGGCASGTLFIAGSGSVRMWVVLVFFCAGCFLATLSMPWWRALPSFGAVSFGKSLGFPTAVGLQLAVLAAIYVVLRRTGKPIRRRQGPDLPISMEIFLRGPWPMLAGALALAGLNWATLAVKGFPWGVTWGFSIWGAKAAQMLGWNPDASAYWSVAWRRGALDASILSDSTSIMNIALIIGALMAASLAGRAGSGAMNNMLRIRSFLAAILGGLMLGYGARLAYGCNIGAFFSGIASTSLHGWVWIIFALLGNAIGVRLRPFFGLAN
jgi:uncharacterized membrane protein YedE/YeeE